MVSCISCACRIIEFKSIPRGNFIILYLSNQLFGFNSSYLYQKSIANECPSGVVSHTRPTGTVSLSPGKIRCYSRLRPEGDTNQMSDEKHFTFYNTGTAL